MAFTNAKKIFAAFLLVVATASSVCAAPALRKGRATAIMLYDTETETRSTHMSDWDGYYGSSYSHSGSSIHGSALASEVIRSALVRSGYKVVSDDITSRILADRKKSTGANALRRISRTHGVTQFVDGSVSVMEALPNELGSFSAEAVVSLNVYNADGRVVFSDSRTAAGASATGDGAQAAAVRKAAEQMAQILIEDVPEPRESDIATAGMYVFVRGAHSLQSLRGVSTACKTVCGVNDTEVRSFEGDSGMIAVYGQFSITDLTESITRNVRGARINTINQSTVYVDLY